MPDYGTPADGSSAQTLRGCIPSTCRTLPPIHTRKFAAQRQHQASKSTHHCSPNSRIPRGHATLLIWMAMTSHKTTQANGHPRHVQTVSRPSDKEREVSFFSLGKQRRRQEDGINITTAAWYGGAWTSNYVCQFPRERSCRKPLNQQRLDDPPSLASRSGEREPVGVRQMETNFDISIGLE